LNATEAVADEETLRTRFSIGQGNWAKVPWIAFLDARETDSTQRGVYRVYLFREDASGLYLVLGQGVTEQKRDLGTAGAQVALADKAAQLRQYCGALAEHAFTEHQIRALARKVARRFVHFLVPGTLLIVSAAPLILIPVGEDYVREGTPVLRVLACACVFQATIALYISVARLRGLGLRILAVNGALIVLLIVGTLVLAAPLGLVGVALAWLGASAAVALSILPSLFRFCRSPSEDEIGVERRDSPVSPRR
jgi:MrcB-like, N-terminal domain